MGLEYKYKFNLGWLAPCLVVAAAFTVARGFILLLFLSSIALFFLLRHSAWEDRKYILYMMGIGVITRLVALLIVQYIVFSDGRLDIFGDAQDNINQGVSVCDFLLGKTSSTVSLDAIFSNRYNTHGKTFFNGLFFALFGKDIVALKYMNILAVVLSSWLVYDVLRRIYSAKAGKIAMTVVLFWPTLFVWSITDLKDSHFILTIVASFWSIIRLCEGGSLRTKGIAGLLLLTALGYAVTLKFRLIFEIVLVATVINVIFCVVLSIYRKRPAEGILLALGMFLISAGLIVFYRLILTTMFQNYLFLIVGFHKGFLSSGGWNYNLLGEGPPGLNSIAFFVKFFVGGWVHFLLEPFPWHLSSVSMLCMYPFMEIWYFLLFLSVLGMIKLGRSGKLWLIFPALVFVFLYISIVGMVVANIGTAVRFRDAIMPFVAVLAACGLTRPDKGQNLREN